MKKNTNNTLGLLSFIALLIFAAIFILAQVGLNVGVLSTIATGLVLFIVLVLSYFYTKKLSIVWRVAFYVIAILAILQFFWGIF